MIFLLAQGGEGGDAVALLTVDNTGLAGIASAHYCDIDAALYQPARKLTGKKKSLKDKSRTLFSIVFFCRFIILGKSWSKTRREIPLLVRGQISKEITFCSAKQGGKSLCSSEDSHFAPQNKEGLAYGLYGFCKN